MTSHALPKPYYEDAAVTIYHGDCREILPLLDGAVDCLMTDPPYGVDKAKWDSTFTDWIFDLVPKSVCAAGFMPGTWNLPRCPQRFGRLVYRWTLIAHHCNGMTRGAVGFGNYVPCLLYSDNETSLHRNDTDLRRFVVGAHSKADHPSPKLIDEVAWFLQRLPGSVIVDPFLGSGTTLRAAKDLGRRAIGIEIEERYCEIAARRMSQGVLDLEAM